MGQMNQCAEGQKQAKGNQNHACKCLTENRNHAQPAVDNDHRHRQCEARPLIRGNPQCRQQAAVGKKKNMLTPELSRLKDAPSTCVCSVRPGMRRRSWGRLSVKPDTCEKLEDPNLGLIRMLMLDQARSHGKARYLREGIGKVRHLRA